MKPLSTHTLKSILKIGFILSDFFAYPLRIFFISGAVFAILACLGLIFAPSVFINLHQFIFLQSFLGAAFAGFLLTALPLWCEVKSSLKPLSISLFVLLCLAFVAEIFSFDFAFLSFDFTLSYGIMSLFWFILLCQACLWLIKSKNTKNITLVLVLFGIFVLSLLKNFAYELNLDYVYIHLCVLATLVVSFRVSLVLGNDALSSLSNPNLNFLPNAVLKNISCFLLFIFIVAILWGKSANLNAFLAFGVGFSLLSRLSSWHYSVFFRTHYTLILYLLFLSLSLVYIGLGFVYLLDISYLSFATHALNLLVLLAFVLFVFNTVSLKHTQNQIFNLSCGTRLSFIALFFAALSRSFLALFAYSFYIVIPALLVLFVFVYFIYKFFPIYKNNGFQGE